MLNTRTERSGQILGPSLLHALFDKWALSTFYNEFFRFQIEHERQPSRHHLLLV